MPKEKRPVIIHMGAPEWMVTFGDMMTLLLTFFILLFSTAQMKDTGKVYDLIYAMQGTSMGMRPVHGFLLPNYNTIIDDLRDEAETERLHFGESGVHSNRMIHSEGESFYSLRIRDQLKIILEGSVYFAEGSPVLLEEGKRDLEKHLVPRFRDGPFRIMVRGLTAPGEAASKDLEDDLGYERAKEVRKFFVEQGVQPHRFEIQAMGSRLDRPQEDPTTPEARERRRRVEIFVSPQPAGAPIEAARPNAG